MSSDVLSDTVAPPLTVGARLASDYTVLACLTRGKTADVYDVWSENRDCRCVAKVLRPERCHDTKAQRALLREGSLLGQQRALCLSVVTALRTEDLGDTPT